MSPSHSTFSDQTEQERRLNDEEEDNLEDDEDSSRDEYTGSVVSDSASFPTQEDLESIMVHAPESIADIENRSVSSVEYGLGHNLSMRSCGSAPESVGSGKDRVTFSGGLDRHEQEEYVGGGGSSVGGMSERSMEVKSSGYDKNSYLSDTERPSKVTITHSTHYQYDIAGIESISIRASSVKSDVATICSGSAAEDIEIASVGTAHSGLAISTTSSFSFDKTSTKRKHDRGVEFAVETSTRFFPGQPLNVVLQTASSVFLSSPLQGPSAIGLDSNAVNDMGPPLRRFLLDRAGSTGSRTGSVRSIDCSPGTPPRAGSLRSFGSQAASEVINTDTEDLGSEGHSSHGPDENHSHSSELAKSSLPSDGTSFNKEDGIQKVISLNEMLSNTSNGRISPGGTVYKGRGVRRYQGRYMHLPMTRFHQNRINEDSSIPGKPTEETISYTESHSKKQQVEPLEKDNDSRHDTNNRWKRCRSWSRSRSRSPLDHRMNRSRSRSRERYGRDRSKSPVSNSSRRNRFYRDGNNKWDASSRGRWRRSNNQNEHNRYQWKGKKRGEVTRRMPPRSAKHRDSSNQM